MDPIEIDTLKSGIRDVVDFPKQGIIFKDITPVLASPKLFSIALDALLETAADQKIDKVVGIDARGFIFGAAIADRIKAGFVPMRKKGKLPFKTISETYTLEYGHSEVELHSDAFQKDDRILLMDDLIATGGTMLAAANLIQRSGGQVVETATIIDLPELGGSQKIRDAGYSVFAVCSFNEDE